MRRRRLSLTVFLVSCSLLAAAYLSFGLQHRWTDSLQKAVQETTRLRIRSGGTCHRQPERETTLAEITDATEINRFVHGIVINGWRSGGSCMCCGNPTFEFYAGDRLLAMVGYHHTERLRWADGKWTGDGRLTAASRNFLITWLAQHGVEGPRREAEGEQKRQEEETRRQKRYAELIPQATFRAAMQAETSGTWSANDPREAKRHQLVAEAFMKQEKDAKTSIELYLRMLGVTADSGGWNFYYDCQQAVVKNLLPRFKSPELAQAAISAMKDEEGRLGAARWFLWERGWRALDEADCERIVPPLAQRGLQHRYMDTRRGIMNVLTEIKSAWAAALLRNMLSRPTDPNWTRPKTKPQYGWKIDLADAEKVYADECSDAVWAAFCLAKMGNIESLPAIQKLADESQGPDKDLLGKALELLRKNAGKTPESTK